MGIGSNLENILKKKGISVAELSRRSEIPASTIYATIRRDSDKMDFSIQDKITKALNISFSDLLPDPVAFDSPEQFEKEWQALTDKDSRSGGWEAEIGYNGEGLTKQQVKFIPATDLIRALEAMNETGREHVTSFAELMAKVPDFQKDK